MKRFMHLYQTQNTNKILMIPLKEDQKTQNKYLTCFTNGRIAFKDNP